MNKDFYISIFGDRYDREAVLFPASVTILLIVFALGNILHGDLEHIDVQDSKVHMTIFAILILIITKIMMWIIRTLSKNSIERLTYGKEKLNFPTISMLLPSSSILSNEYKNRILLKAQKDFEIDLNTSISNQEDETKVRKVIAEVTNLIRKKVSRLERTETYLIKNIRYGRCRNMIGGSTIAILIQLVITIYSAIKGYSLFCPIISITISCMLDLYMFYIYKQAGIEYAKELFENYLICKNNE